ncbi:winged helix-turn-helix transcriptional regulator [Rhodococcus sp. NPDC019627]|uniref:winged helix-turn-helix transcriptional regulator n=1 Tax=unclassified Rhodococcus (in: high G+C Gram-positive bacteria) TaxID=192944 RepID=UPI0033EFD7AA
MATTTAGQARHAAKRKYDVYLANCPSRQLLDRISDKWVSLILVALGQGSRRYSELARELAGVSQKMLTQTLRALERDGLVAREVTAAVPVRVDYELTELGRSLLPILRAVKQWAEHNMDDVTTARERYDGRAQ